MDDLPPPLPYVMNIKLKSLLYMLLLCLVFLAVAFHLYLHPEISHNPGFVQFIGILGILFCGLALCAMAYRFFKRAPLVTLTKEGISEKPGMLVKWDEITGFRISTVRVHSRERETGVAVMLKAPESYIQKFNRGKVNMNLAGTPMVLNTRLGGVKNKVLLEWLNYYWTQNTKA